MARGILQEEKKKIDGQSIILEKLKEKCAQDVAKKIANTKSDALTQFEMVLQNAEKALHIEDERENNRVMQEDLDRQC